MLSVRTLTFANLFALCLGSCYFSAELQGEYVMQTVTAGAQVQYSLVNITAEAIPMWGMCHHRQGNNVILNDSFNGTACMRCFHLKLQSPNVLQVHTCPNCLDQCYLTEEAAQNTCPRPHDFSHNKYKEITLFRTKELGGGPIRKMFCPITGHYSFTYNLFNQTDNRVDCNPTLSHIESCADRSPTHNPQIDVHFQGCSHQYNEMTFECLGDWPGPAGQRYLALHDTSASAREENRPQYRCALYKEDEVRGNVIMAFSSDSTCTTDLYNATYGHMTWNLTTVSSPGLPWPSPVINSQCSFPYWSQGKWEHLSVSLNTLTYKDQVNFNTYTMRCAQAANDDTFLIFSKNGCGEDVYKCLRMKLRSTNVLEFQIGLSTSSFPNSSICSESNFLRNTWVTQARLEGLQVSPCPVTGEYSGYIPKQPGLCAKLASDQLHGEIMYFTVSDCEQMEVYEGTFQNGRHKRQDDGITKITIDDLNPTAEAEQEFPQILSTVSGTEVKENVETGISKNTSSVEPTTVDVVVSSETTAASTENTSAENVAPTEYYLSQTYNLSNDSEQVESYSIQKMAQDPGKTPGAVKPNTPFPREPVTSYTIRPHRSFQPPNMFTTPSLPPYRSQPYIPGTGTTTTQWYSINPQLPTRSPPYSRSGPDNYRGGYRAWDTPWNTGYNSPWPRVSEYPQYTPNQRTDTTSRTFYNTTSRPGDFRDWNFQNTRQNWNFEGRHRNQMGFPYIPYRGDNTNYQRPIALPPIQLPPLYTEPARPEQWDPSRTLLFKEEREYQCLGQWEEDGVTYTYTQRKDFGSYECFVGTIVSHNEIYIKEAGEHCGRGIDPITSGMKLNAKVGTMRPVVVSPPSTTPTPLTSWYTTKRPTLATRPWKPITAPPPRQHSGVGHMMPALLILVLSSVISLTS